jgi:hypothetical protein
MNSAMIVGDNMQTEHYNLQRYNLQQMLRYMSQRCSSRQMSRCDGGECDALAHDIAVCDVIDRPKTKINLFYFSYLSSCISTQKRKRKKKF